MSENAVLPAGQIVAHYSAQFEAVVTAVVVEADPRVPCWRLLRVIYKDEFANHGRGDLRTLYTWEHVETMRPLADFTQSGRKVERAILRKCETATSFVVAAS